MATKNKEILDLGGGSRTTCGDNCKLLNKALVSYDYIIDKEQGTNTTESNSTSTCVLQTPSNSFTTFKVASQRYVKPGDIVTYTIAVTNTGNTVLNSVKVTDILDSNTSFADGANLYVNNVYVAPVVTVVGQTVTLAFPVGQLLQPGQSAIFTFKVKVNNGVASNTIIPNKASIDAKAPNDTDLTTKDTNTTQLTVKFVDIEVTKTAPESVQCGENLTYTIKVKNKSTTDPATNVVITDYFAQEFGFILADVTVSAPGATKALIAPNGLKVTIPTIAANATETITISGTVNCCLS